MADAGKKEDAPKKGRMYRVPRAREGGIWDPRRGEELLPLPGGMPTASAELERLVEPFFASADYGYNVRFGGVTHFGAAQHVYQRFRSVLRANCGGVRLVFHGTARRNLPKIRAAGLLHHGITGSGVREENGSAFGVGIYLGKRPGISLGYCCR